MLSVTLTDPITEDSAVAGDVVAQVSADDEDGGAISYSISDTTNYAIDASSGEVTLTAAGAAIVNGGGDLPNFDVTASSTTGATSTDTVTVNPTDTTLVNDPSFLDLDANDSSGTAGTGYKTTYLEGGNPARIADTDISISDVDNATLTGARIQITNVEAGDFLSIGALPGGITASAYNPSTGVITLSGTASLAAYQTAIRAIQYSNDGSASGADRIVNIAVNDGVDWSNTAVSTIAMQLVPTISVSDVSVQEPQSGTLSMTFTVNVDTAPTSALTFTVKTQDGSATGGSDYQSIAPTTYTIPAGATSATITVIVNSDSNQFEGDEAFYLQLTGFNQTVNFAPGSQTIAGGVQATGHIGANNGAPEANDDVFITGVDEALVTGNVLSNDVLVDNASITGFQSTSTNGGTVVNNGDGTFTYTPASGFTGADSFTYTLTDADGETSTATVTVEVAATVVQPPEVTGVVDVDYLENAGAQALLGGIQISDVDSSTLSSVVVEIAGYIPGQDQLTYLTAGTSVTVSAVQSGSTYTLTFSGGVDIAEYQTVLRTLNYTNTSDNPSAAQREVTVTAYDSDYANLGDSETFTLTVQPVNDAPEVTDKDLFAVEGSLQVPMAIQAPTDADTDVSELQIVVQSLPATSTGTVFLSDGVTPVSAGQVLTMAQLTSLVFTAGVVEASDAFVYTVFDGELTTTGTVSINVGATEPDFGTVYESGLPDGNSVEGQSAEVSGNLFENDGAGAGTLTSIEFNSVSYTAVGGIITVDTPLGVLSVNATTGDYTYTLDTADSTGNDVAEQFVYNYNNGVDLSDTLTITIVDDVPTANDLVENIPESEEQIFNLILTLDASGSMAWGAMTGSTNPGAGEPTRMALAKQALTALASEYFNQSSQVTITLVQFSGSAAVVGTYTDLGSFNAGLATVNAGGGTNYVDATDEIRTQFQADLAAQNPADNVQNISYFISDGEPNAGTSPIGSGFIEYVNANGINSYAVGIGSSLPSDLEDLNYIHNIDSLGKGGGHVDAALHVPDLSLLESELLSTVPTAFGGNITVNGSVSNVVFGADGGYVSEVSMDIGGTLYTFTYSGVGSVSASPALSGLIVDGSKITIGPAVLAFGLGTFSFDFSDGGYTFSAPNGLAGNSLQFDYTVSDNDGDVQSASATINIVDDSPDARDDLVIAVEGNVTEGNVITGLGTDGGPALGSDFTPFAVQGGGVDKIVDNAALTQFTYKGQTIGLELTLVTQPEPTGASANVALTSAGAGNGSVHDFLITTPSGTLVYTAAGNARGLGVNSGDSDNRLNNGERIDIAFDEVALPYGVQNLQIAMRDFTADNSVSITLFGENNNVIATLVRSGFSGGNGTIDLSAYEGVYSVSVTGQSGGDGDALLFNLAYDPTPAPAPELVETGGNNGSNLSWTFSYDFDLSGNPIYQATVMDSNDASVYVMRSNGYFSYTSNAAANAQQYDIDTTSAANVSAGDFTLTSPAGISYDTNGAIVAGGPTFGDGGRISEGETMSVNFSSVTAPDGVQNVVLTLGSYAPGEAVYITVVDKNGSVLINNQLFDSANIDLSGYGNVARVDITGAPTNAGQGDLDSNRATHVGLLAVQYAISPTAGDLLDPVLVDYVLTDKDGQSDSARLAVFTPDNNILGSAGADSISGGALNDAITGLDGDDILAGNAGHDTLSGGAGNDILSGGAGMDYLLGGLGNDTLDGGADDDLLNGGAGNDLLDGGLGNDILLGESGNDALYGGSGNDRLEGGAGNDILYGGSGNDILFGDDGTDTLFGNAGDDILTGGRHIDTFVWNSPDAGSTDIITDFQVGFNGDILHLADLLTGENAGNLEEYLQFTESGGDTYIHIDVDGGATFESSQVIILQGVDITAAGTLSTQQILDDLLAGGNLTIDT
ncbi:Ig-like domain-containing protein [Simiduia agarivorans]|nr:Ig-like domain-containing protein [Simiduia agarivorans]